MEPKIKSWESSIGTVTVTTSFADGETEAEWCARHDSAIAASMLIWPEIEAAGILEPGTYTLHVWRMGTGSIVNLCIPAAS